MSLSVNYKENEREFHATCSNIESVDKGKYLSKICPFGELRLWKKSGRISTISTFDKLGNKK